MTSSLVFSRLIEIPPQPGRMDDERGFRRSSVTFLAVVLFLPKLVVANAKEGEIDQGIV